MSERINANDLLATVNAVSVTDPAEVKWHGLEISIKRRLSLSDMMRFVDYVVKSCFSEDAVYLPEIRDFAIGCSIIEQYTNIDLPESVEDKYEAINGSDIVNVILEYVDMRQFNKILEAIDDKIDAIVQTNISAVTRQINSLYASIEELEKQFEAMFGDVTGEDVTNLIGAITNGKLDEEKLMDAYVSKRVDNENTVIDIRNALPKEGEE